MVLGYSKQRTVEVAQLVTSSPCVSFRPTIEVEGLPDSVAGDGSASPAAIFCALSSFADAAKLGIVLIFQIIFECHLTETKWRGLVHTAAGSPVCGHPLSCLEQENTALHLGEWGRNVNKCLCLGTQQQTGTSELPEKHPAGEKEHMGFPEQLVLRSNGV